MDPHGSTAYYLLFDRRTSVFQGLWAIPTRGGEPRALIAAPKTTATATLAAERTYPPQLVISDDGEWIVFASCPTAACEFLVTHPDGTAEDLDSSAFRFGDRVMGIAGHLLIGSTDCPEATCDGFALDLRTGERWPLGGAEHPYAPAAVIPGPHGPLVLGVEQQFDQGRWYVEALDLTDGRRSIVFESSFEPGVTTVRLAAGDPEGDTAARAELPPGWFLVYRFTDAEALLVPPDYSAATLGAARETQLSFMNPSAP
jgi:hypothetical protein